MHELDRRLGEPTRQLACKTGTASTFHAHRYPALRTMGCLYSTTVVDVDRCKVRIRRRDGSASDWGGASRVHRGVGIRLLQVQLQELRIRTLEDDHLQQLHRSTSLGRRGGGLSVQVGSRVTHNASRPQPHDRRTTNRESRPDHRSGGLRLEPGRIALEDRPIPEVGPRDALLRVMTTTICGTDLHQRGTRAGSP